MSHTFKPTDAQTTSTTADAGDSHLTNARNEISNARTIEPVASMRTDTASGVLPSGNIEKDNSIVFGPNNGGDGHNHNGDSATEDGNGSHSPGDGHNHTGTRTDTASGAHTTGDGDNHDGGPNDAVAGTHSVSDGHRHNAASSAQSNLANGDTGALNEQTRMSQEAAKLGLGARDIALIQQLGSSVPHSSPRELAERLKSARERGGILNLNRDSDDPPKRTV